VLDGLRQPRNDRLDDRSVDFFDFGGVAYLNCAYHGPLPRVSARAAVAAMRIKQTPHRVQDEYHFTFPDAYRAAVARLIGCASSDVAVTDSTTHGIMTLVGGLDWRRGDEVVIPEGEFPANLFPWRSLERDGVVLKQLALDPLRDDGSALLEAIADAITSRTRVVSVSWVSYVTGLRYDLAALGRLCRERDVLFVVDGSQGIGGLPFDVRETPCDLVACSGYKWMLGPYGLGFAYVNPELAERLRPFNVNWFAIAGARDFNRLSRAQFAFERHARRFDINEAANFINTAAGTASVHYLLEITPAAVERHVRALQQHLVDNLPDGFNEVRAIPDRMRSNILRVVGPDQGATRAAYERALERNVVLSMREGAIRIAPHIYNTAADVQRLLEAIANTPLRRVSVAALPRGDVVDAPGGVTGPSGAAAAWLARAPHRGRHYSLLPLDPEHDADSLFAVSHGDAARDAVWTYMPYGPFASPEEMSSWLRECAQSNDPVWFTVVQEATGTRAGMVSFLNLQPSHRALELGHIWYGPEFQHTEANTEAVHLMLCEAFDRLACRRVEWKCDALNERSRLAASRLGFAFEGVFRQHRVVKGRNRDTAWYAMLDRDWPTVQANLSSWLDAEPDARPSLARMNAARSDADGAILERLGCIPRR
jgi:selenocysteine lyase/cysteine desulfurase/RimJ/RimL family protein N-acetyltransferase